MLTSTDCGIPGFLTGKRWSWEELPGFALGPPQAVDVTLILGS